MAEQSQRPSNESRRIFPLCMEWRIYNLKNWRLWAHGEGFSAPSDLDPELGDIRLHPRGANGRVEVRYASAFSRCDVELTFLNPDGQVICSSRAAGREGEQVLPGPPFEQLLLPPGPSFVGTQPLTKQQPPVGGGKMKASHKGFLLWHLLALAYYLSSSFCQCERLTVDLSHPFDQDTLYWVTEPALVLNVTYNGTLNDYWYQKEVFSAATHGGTHLDAPCHFAKGAWCVSDIPLPRLVARPAAVVDISSFVGADPTVHLSPAHLAEWEEQHGSIPPGAVLLVRTGWSSRWPDPLAYTGSAHRKKEELKFPSISGSAAKWLVENRDVVGVGVDTMSVDPPGSAHPTTHVTLAERNVYGLENVNDLHLLPPVGATVYVMPMKLVGASGAPCRIFAETVTGVAHSFCANLWYVALAVVCVVLSCHF